MYTRLKLSLLHGELEKYQMRLSAHTNHLEFCLGIDVGGTFTDAVLVDQEGKVHLFKAPTVPANPTEGLFHCLNNAARSQGLSLEDLLRQTSQRLTGSVISLRQRRFLDSLEQEQET